MIDDTKIRDYIISPNLSGEDLTQEVAGVDQLGNRTDISVIEERPLTIFLNNQEIVTAMYAEIIAQKDKTINQTDHGSDNLTAAGLVDGDKVYCIPRYSGANGFKRQRQEEKLRIAVSKRKGLAAADTNASYYRAVNTKTKTNLPTLYTPGNNDSGNLVDNANSGGLVNGRPWT